MSNMISRRAVLKSAAAGAAVALASPGLVRGSRLVWRIQLHGLGRL